MFRLISFAFCILVSIAFARPTQTYDNDLELGHIGNSAACEATERFEQPIPVGEVEQNSNIEESANTITKHKTQAQTHYQQTPQMYVSDPFVRSTTRKLGDAHIRLGPYGNMRFKRDDSTTANSQPVIMQQPQPTVAEMTATVATQPSSANNDLVLQNVKWSGMSCLPCCISGKYRNLPQRTEEQTMCAFTVPPCLHCGLNRGTVHNHHECFSSVCSIVGGGASYNSEHGSTANCGYWIPCLSRGRVEGGTKKLPWKLSGSLGGTYGSVDCECVNCNGCTLTGACCGFSSHGCKESCTCCD